jgi:hypothetical protein
MTIATRHHWLESVWKTILACCCWPDWTQLSQTRCRRNNNSDRTCQSHLCAMNTSICVDSNTGCENGRFHFSNQYASLTLYPRLCICWWVLETGAGFLDDFWVAWYDSAQGVCCGERETKSWKSFEGHRLCLRNDWDRWALLEIWFIKLVREPASCSGVTGVHWGLNLGLESQKVNIRRAYFSRWP